MKTKGLEQLLVTDYIDRSINYIENIEVKLNEAPSYNKRCNVICDVLKRGIAFGLLKGGAVYKNTQNKIEDSKKARYDKWLKEMIYSINEEIEQYMIKNKYKKKL